MKRHISITDIAQELGVSASTVSRALHDSKEISASMRERVKNIAQRYNYHPDPFAVGLLKKTSRIIGIIIPDIISHFYSAIISGINDSARANGYSVIITTSYEKLELEKQCVDDLCNIRVEGIIACLSQETFSYEHFANVVNQGVPIVFFDRVCMNNQCPCVVADNRESARKATNHLIERGFSRIAYIGGDSRLDIVRQRRNGYEDALLAHRMQVQDELIICNKMTHKDGRRAMRQLLSLAIHPDAVLAMNDTLAFAAMKEIREHGLRIPEDIALIGYSDEQHAMYSAPELTTVTHHTYEIGSVAFDLLLHQLTEEQFQPRTVVVPTFLKVRESTTGQHHTHRQQHR